MPPRRSDQNFLLPLGDLSSSIFHHQNASFLVDLSRANETSLHIHGHPIWLKVTAPEVHSA